MIRPCAPRPPAAHSGLQTVTSGGEFLERASVFLGRSPMLRVGLVGYGYWGPNLARNFNANPDCRLVRIADMSERRRALAASSYPDTEVVEHDSRVTEADDIDVVIVATP